MAIREIKCQIRVSEDGKEIKMINRKEFEKLMKENFSGHTVIATFRKTVRKRSNAQNGYYHKIVVQFVYDALIESGYDKKELDHNIVHDFLRNKFNIHEIVSDQGESIKIVKSTSDLTTTEFALYISEIQRWASETLHIYIPDPNEQAQLEY